MDQIDNDNNVPMDIYQMAKEANIESEDSYRYEIDTNIHFEKLYNQWIGYTKMDGEWVRDPHKKPVMNIEMADKLINEMSMLVNTHSSLSILKTDEIKRIAWRFADGWNRTLMFQAATYKLNVNDFQRFPMTLFNHMVIMLKLAQNGHTVHYRMNKGKINVVRQEVGQQGVI